LREIALAIKRDLHLPVEAREISPEKLTGRTIKEIESTSVWEGNTRLSLADIFTVTEKTDGSDDETTIRVVGNAAKVRKIGYRTSSGSVIIEGNAGMYLGEEMAGGSIVVAGDAGSWLGMKMKGGQIEVKGNAGDYVGAGYRGTALGMKGGSILIHGNAGQEVGCWMTDGTIRIKGNVGLLPGIHMRKGTIYVEGKCDGRAGGQMTGGKVIVGGRIPSILPSFTFEEIRDTAKVGEEKIRGPFYVFSGDMNENGKGRLSVNVNNNPQLKWYERYLEA
jgi:formylmethanofuran dehydrogenase subunit C